MNFCSEVFACVLVMVRNKKSGLSSPFSAQNREKIGNGLVQLIRIGNYIRDK